MLKQYLLTPGPTPIPPQIALKEALPVIHHRTSEFASIYKDVAEGLKYVFQTRNEVYVLACSGTGAMEMAIVNLLSPNDKILVASCGNFGERWAKIAQSYGVETIYVSVEWGKVLDPLEIEKTLKKNPDIKAVFTTFVETSTGVASDIKSIGKIVSQTNAVFVVDAISGLAGQEFRTDDWEVDVVISASQKDFMLPPGLAFIMFSQKTQKLIELSRLPKFYFDIKKYRDFYLINQTPFTSPVTLIVALQEALKLIRNKKIENIWNDCKRLARAARAGMQSLGLKLFAEVPCEVVTTASVPENIGEKIITTLKERYSVSIAGGQGKLNGKIIRLAHMGYIGKVDLLAGFACLEIVLSELGMDIEKGKSVAAVQKEFLG
ncbi:MAG: alanine--glyoxylate aminotransferase family protein [Endomicrobium sp.]|jgi:aspartate aminotransferase-like enzyme|uniref:pyridoxal-phosphate-dependent aminotransferase family protein n=1 Tax=Candidatus Endomicrobiellum cubanum TaxID=3242325 RepID=UPI00282FB114|nr:alanine--glyoxylate aminotransferase family protein [Endomicrobium sp.]